MKLKSLAIALLGASLLAACGAKPEVVTPEPQTPVVPTDPKSFGQLSTLKPGEQGIIEQKLDVNIVSIGFESTGAGQVAGARDLNFAALSRELPQTYQTINRYPSFYGNNELSGNNFSFNYNYVTAPKTFEDEFFSFLVANGKEMAVKQDGLTYLNISSAAYNCQATKPLKMIYVEDDKTPVYACPQDAGNISRTVTGNLEVDGQLVEKWLADNGSKLGIDTTKHTVFLIN